MPGLELTKKKEAKEVKTTEQKQPKKQVRWCVVIAVRCCQVLSETDRRLCCKSLETCIADLPLD